MQCATSSASSLTAMAMTRSTPDSTTNFALLAGSGVSIQVVRLVGTQYHTLHLADHTGASCDHAAADHKPPTSTA